MWFSVSYRFQHPKFRLLSLPGDKTVMNSHRWHLILYVLIFVWILIIVFGFRRKYLRVCTEETVAVAPVDCTLCLRCTLQSLLVLTLPWFPVFQSQDHTQNHCLSCTIPPVVRSCHIRLHLGLCICYRNALEMSGCFWRQMLLPSVELGIEYPEPVLFLIKITL